MIRVVIAIIMMDQSITRRRPILSAKVPSRMPPSGRNAKPTAKTASALSVAATGSCDGKNLGPMKADSRPKTIQSYHSRVFPSPRPSSPRRTSGDSRDLRPVSRSVLTTVSVMIPFSFPRTFGVREGTDCRRAPLLGSPAIETIVWLGPRGGTGSPHGRRVSPDSYACLFVALECKRAIQLGNKELVPGDRPTSCSADGLADATAALLKEGNVFAARMHLPPEGCAP